MSRPRARHRADRRASSRPRSSLDRAVDARALPRRPAGGRRTRRSSCARRAAAIARFDQARDHDPFLDFWFSEDARFRIRDMVARLTKRADGLLAM